MAKIILVTHFEPLPVGHGGNHRSYQMLYDIEKLISPENVTVILSPLYSDHHFLSKNITKNCWFILVSNLFWKYLPFNSTC
jgi:hypothetical protein